MSSISNKALAAVKKRLAEDEQKRKEHQAWKTTPVGLHGNDFGERLRPWILALAESISVDQKMDVVALHVTRRALHDDEDPFEWPCGRGEFEATVHRFPKGSVQEGFASSPFLAGCRCPPADAWALTLGLGPGQEGLLGYGLLPDSQQFWFMPADLGDASESPHYFDGSPGFDQIARDEMVVHVCGVRDTSIDPEASHPCSVGAVSLDHATNFLFPHRGADALFNATLEGFFQGEHLVPQFHRHPPPGPQK